MGKPSAPEPPDPQETAAAQTATNVSTATANSYLGNVNQVTPYGSLTYTNGANQFVADKNGQALYQSPTGRISTTKPTDMKGWTALGTGYTVPTTTATQTLSKDQQRLLNINNDTQESLARTARSSSARIGNLLSTPFSLGGAPAAGDAGALTAPNYQRFASGPQLQTTYGPSDNYSSNVKEVQDALMTRLQPSLDSDRRALETRLAEQGISYGSQAYNSAMDDYSRGANDQRTSVVLRAGEEQSRLAGLDYQRAGFGNDANQQMWSNENTTTGANNSLEDQSFNAQQARIDAQNTQRSNFINEQYAMRNQPLNEISALMSGGQVSNPNFVPTQGAQLPTVDYAGLVQSNYQNQVGAYNAQMAQSQGLLGGLFGLGAAGIMASDKRVKQDITRVGEVDGQKIYRFRYKDGGPMQLGVLAQDIEKSDPDAVMEIGGVKHVDYGKLFQLGEAA
jgi:hypothetical protein